MNPRMDRTLGKGTVEVQRLKTRVLEMVKKRMRSSSPFIRPWGLVGHHGLSLPLGRPWASRRLWGVLGSVSPPGTTTATVPPLERTPRQALLHTLLTAAK